MINKNSWPLLSPLKALSLLLKQQLVSSQSWFDEMTIESGSGQGDRVDFHLLSVGEMKSEQILYH